MIDTGLVAAKQVGVLFVLIAVGILLRRRHILEGKGISSLTDILFYIISPSVIINSLVTTAASGAFARLGWSALAASAGFAVVYTAVTLIFIGRKSPDINAVKYSSIFANMGFMGLPLARALGGEEAVACVGVSIAIFTMLNFILGIALFTPKRKSVIPIIFNPGTVAIIIAVTMILLPFDIPAVVMSPISMLASTQTPMAMLLCGGIFGGISLRGWYKDKYLWLATLLRLIVMPVLTTATLLLLPIPRDVASALAVAFACPAAVSGSMFAEKFGGRTELLTKTIALTTALSIFTIPVVAAVCAM